MTNAGLVGVRGRRGLPGEILDAGASRSITPDPVAVPARARHRLGHPQAQPACSRPSWTSSSRSTRRARRRGTARREVPREHQFVKKAALGGGAEEVRARGASETYGGKYQMDYLLMAAQGYQESQLDQRPRARWRVGVMQVMPATGKELKVGDVHELEPNIHAGVKYMRFMIDQYLGKEPMDNLNKGLFAFASYNAGPARSRTAKRGAGGARPKPVVRQRGARGVGEDRAGDGDLRRQHLQVLHRLQAHRGGPGRAQEGARIGRSHAHAGDPVESGSSRPEADDRRRLSPTGQLSVRTLPSSRRPAHARDPGVRRAR